MATPPSSNRRSRALAVRLNNRRRVLRPRWGPRQLSRRGTVRCWPVSFSDCGTAAFRIRSRTLHRPHAARPASGGSAIASGSAAPAAANAAMPTADQQTGGQARRSSGEGDSAPSPADVMAAQRFLMRLGYSPGAPDGVLGERTQRALDEYRRRTGAAADGRVLSDALLTKLRRDASRAAARESQLSRIAAQSPRRHDGASSWVGSIAGGFQRLLGHEFDSRKQPGRLRDYCRDNRETWIFDEGRGDFAYCGHLLAAQ